MPLQTHIGNELTDQQITDISELIVQTIKESYPTEIQEPLTGCMTPDLMRRKTQEAYCALYEEDDRIVGFGYLAFRNNQWEVKSMYVSKRGQGIGTQILHALEQEARRRGIATVYLESLENPATLQFYQKHGYQIIKEHDYAGGIHCTIMKKEI